jgi:hypothetical protein
MSQDRGPRCPDPSSAKSRLSSCISKTVRDIPKFRPPSPVWVSAISRSGQAPFQTKSRTNGEKPRDIADIGPKRVVTSRTRDLPKFVRSRTPRIGSGYRGQSAKLVTSRTQPPRAPPPVWAAPTPPVGGTGWVEPLEWRGRPCDARGGQACLLSTDPGPHRRGANAVPVRPAQENVEARLDGQRRGSDRGKGRAQFAGVISRTLASESAARPDHKIGAL